MSHEERAHAELGGSSASRWMNCPGSVFLLRGIEKQPPGRAAIEGTKAHEAAEIVLEDFLEHKVSGADPDIRARLMSHDDSVMEAAYGYRDAIWKEILNEALTGKAYGLEEHFTLDEHLGMFGTADFWCVFIDDRGKRAGCIVDFKFGYTPVSVERNAQLAFYAAALRQEIKDGGKDLDYVIGGIYQPKVQGSSALSITKFTGKQLDTWQKKFLKAAHDIYVKKKAKFKAGAWCQYCDAKAVCKAYKASIETKSSLKLVDPDEVSFPAPETVPDEAISRLLMHAEDITKYLSACAAYALSRHAHGKPLPGLKVVAGQTRRAWPKDEESVLGIAEDLMNRGLEDVYGPPKLKGITVIEKALSKIEGPDTARHIVSSYCPESAPKPKIVPESDPRPPMLANVDLLGPIDEEE